MPTKTDDDVGTEETKGTGAGKGAGKGSRRTILIVVGALLLGAVAYKFVLAPKQAATAAAIDGASPTTTVEQETEVVTLDPITLNLADGHLLKVGMAIEVVPKDAEKPAQSKGATTTVDSKTKGYAHAIDIAITVFGARTYADVVDPKGREGAKAELIGKLHDSYAGEIKDVYLYQFVAQ